MSDPIAMLADRFVAWQGDSGRPDPDRCPFVTPGPCISTQFHSPTFLAIALYEAAGACDSAAYRAAADRYVVSYLASVCDPLEGDQQVHRPSYPFIYGMGLAAYAAYKRAHPGDTMLDQKAASIYDWLGRFRWDNGSWFRNGYGNPAKNAIDCGFSEDNLNIGRGLVGLHSLTARADVLADAEGLAGYYLTDLEPGTYDGCWSDALGTWAVGPTEIDSFEHFEGRRSWEIGWGFTSTGAIEYLTGLAAATTDEHLRARIAQRCAASLRWQLEDCQFDDGACGLAGRDDRWLGMTAGAILSYLRCRDAGFLSEADIASLAPRARAARDWLRANTTPDAVDRGGYFPVTMHSEPRPPENLAWMLAWTLLALIRAEEVA